MKQYQQLLRDINDFGNDKGDRTGTGTRSLFGYQMRFDLNEGFPLLTTKKVHFKSVIYELLWMLNGDTNIKYLQDNGVSIWDEWADANGNLGPVYGAQWRSWPGNEGGYIDQITELLRNLKGFPDSRRHVVTAWNPADLPCESFSIQENVKDGSMALAPCHCLFQFYVADNKLSCQLYQRSADVFLGVPFNIASYAMLTHMIAQQCDLGVGEFIWTGGDVHLYKNHKEQALELLKRTPKALPSLGLVRAPSLFEYTADMVKVTGYDPYPAIKAEVSI